MTPGTALRLLGALASLKLQRRYIVHGTVDSYLVPSELVENGYYFLRQALLGKSKSLASVQQFRRVLEEVGPNLPDNDPTVSGRVLVEEHPDWGRLREAAKSVLEEMGAALGPWEAEHLS
jgi:hypothetical protein